MSVGSFIVNVVSPSTPIPYIALWGEVMEEAGFVAGKKLIAEVREKGEIVLKLVDEEEV
jgi:hypothetical protein